jgi:protein-S-isoprenylcysteine O-methyltransferase Ste14
MKFVKKIIMTLFIKFFLLIYFIIFYGIAFFGTSFFVAKKIGKNPNVLPNDDSAYGLIGKYFKIILITIFLYVILLSFCSLEFENIFLKITYFDSNNLKICGIILMIFSLIWVIIAQINMKESWRIGIDKEVKTELISYGLFKYSRNPIFLGMILSLAGLFLTSSNCITLTFLIVGYILIQIQIRLEEEFLQNIHGKLYTEYKNNVRRML